MAKKIDLNKDPKDFTREEKLEYAALLEDTGNSTGAQWVRNEVFMEDTGLDEGLT